MRTQPTQVKLTSLSILIATILVLPLAAPAQDFVNDERTILTQIIEDIERLRTVIDRSYFETEAVLNQSDFESEIIIDFVRDRICFEQYPGLLRGSKGTLMSRAGNALDQSFLLASLLRDAGYDARIVRGELDSHSATILLSQIQACRPDAANIQTQLI